MTSLAQWSRVVCKMNSAQHADILGTLRSIARSMQTISEQLTAINVREERKNRCTPTDCEAHRCEQCGAYCGHHFVGCYHATKSA